MKKLLTIIIFAAALLTMTTGVALAQDPTPITGTVESVVPQLDETTGETIYIVTLTDEFGTTHVVNLSQTTAEGLGLITVDTTTGEVTINDVVDPITVNPEDVLPTEGEGEEEEPQHPVGAKLGEYFGELLGIDYEIIMEQKEEGFGFGVIAQALWLTKQIDGDTETFTALLEAKKSGDYSDITLADGSTPDNWGDVVKSLKKGEKLGSVMSGKAETETDDTAPIETQTTNGRSNGNSDNNGKGNGNSGEKENGNKGGNGKGNGNGKP